MYFYFAYTAYIYIFIIFLFKNNTIDIYRLLMSKLTKSGYTIVKSNYSTKRIKEIKDELFANHLLLTKKC